MYIPRVSEEDIRQALLQFPVVLITGARQVGKSTLALHLEGYHYATLDDLTLFSAARDDPVGVIASLAKPVILDEIQKVPELLVAIKRFIDADRTNGQFVLTGSANVLAFKEVSDTLAGRMAIFELMPLSMRERRQQPGNLVDELFAGSLNLGGEELDHEEIPRSIISGGYPEMVRIQDAKGRYFWFSSYIRTYIERDVRDIGEIRNLDGFIRLHHSLAARSANILNKSELGKACALDQKTLANYLALLERVYQVTLLRPYSSNIGKRFVKNPKLFFNDSGALSHLLNVHGLDDFDASPYQGMLLETFVFAELRKHLSLSSKITGFYYYRTADKEEVDFILERAGRVVAVEVKRARSVHSRDFKSIRSIQKALAKSFQLGVILYQGDQLLPFGDDLLAVPVKSLF